MLRSLVLKLSLLSTSDQQWFLKQLSGEEAKRVKALLNEIEELGLNSHNQITIEDLNQITQSKPSPLVYREPSDLDGVESLNAYWQRLVFSSLDAKERETALKRFNLKVNQAETLQRVPPGLANSIVSVLKERVDEPVN